MSNILAPQERLELPVYRLEGGCIIHYATGANKTANTYLKNLPNKFFN